MSAPRQEATHRCPAGHYYACLAGDECREAEVWPCDTTRCKQGGKKHHKAVDHPTHPDPNRRGVVILRKTTGQKLHYCARHRDGYLCPDAAFCSLPLKSSLDCPRCHDDERQRVERSRRFWNGATVVRSDA